MGRLIQWHGFHEILAANAPGNDRLTNAVPFMTGDAVDVVKLISSGGRICVRPLARLGLTDARDQEQKG